jgi:two-component system, NtrC family, response regulator HydG
MKTILIIDDDKDFRYLTKRQLTDHGFNCLECATGIKAFELLETEHVDLILSDLNLRKENGKEILARVASDYPSIPVIIVTGYPNVRSTVDLMRLGAADYLMKPLDMEQLIAGIQMRIGEQKLRAEVNVNAEQKEVPVSAGSTEPAYAFSSGEFIRKTLAQINIVAPTNYSVIIYGESGSGKEAFAREIHNRSKRSSKPFVAIDCGALSKELSASTLFGHEKGAFTGALMEKEGVFESAHGGTVFLDEIANLPYEVQVSLLRMTQERKVRHVGGTREIPVDVRIIVASNQKLWDLCLVGQFREDLYHRLNEFAFHVLPLRERQEDIQFYAALFLSKANYELGKSSLGFTAEAMNAMLEYAWPGNLRELRNVVRRSLLGSKTDSICLDDLRWHPSITAEPQSISNNPKAAEEIRGDDELINALEQTGFSKRKVGKMLNLTMKSLNTRMKRLRF